MSICFCEAVEVVFGLCLAIVAFFVSGDPAEGSGTGGSTRLRRVHTKNFLAHVTPATKLLPVRASIVGAFKYGTRSSRRSTGCINTDHASGLIPKANDVIFARGTRARRRFYRPNLLGRSSSLHAGVRSGVSVVGERHPPVGVTVLEFNVIFRRNSVGGVVFNVPR